MVRLKSENRLFSKTVVEVGELTKSGQSKTLRLGSCKTCSVFLISWRQSFRKSSYFFPLLTEILKEF